MILFVLIILIISSLSLAIDEEEKCTLCWAALNELEGLLAEGANQKEIEKQLDERICSHFKSPLCQDLVDYGIPALSLLLNQKYHVGAVCQEINFCKKPDFNHPDKTPLPEFVLDLDLPAHERYNKLLSTPRYRDGLNKLLNAIKKYTNLFVKKTIDEMGSVILSTFTAEYKGELQGIAKAMNTDVNLLAFAQIAYSVTDGCTSLVANDASGRHVLHVRNLDFGAGLGFTDVLRQMAYHVKVVKGGRTLFHGASFAGFIGMLTGMVPNGFSVTIDTRFMNKNPLAMLAEQLEQFIKNRNTMTPPHLLRDVLTRGGSFHSAVHALSATPLISDVYYIVGGTNVTEGVVLSRAQTKVDHADWIGAKKPPIGTLEPDWFVVQTNYDNWNLNKTRFNPLPSPQNPNVPIFDNRREAVLDGLKKIPRAAVSLPRLMDVVSTRPVLNQLTTYTVEMVPATGHFELYGRYCNSPCPF